MISMSRVYPFKRKIQIGEQKWYEKIALQYTGTFNNSVTTKENELFQSEMFDDMKFGMQHAIPLSVPFIIFNFVNLTPQINYNERWYFDKIDREWNPELQQLEQDTVDGFYRLYDYSTSLSFSTILYGMYQFGANSKIQAIRHMMTPSISVSYTPDFGSPEYGYYKNVQTDAQGTIRQYSPFETGIYGVPSSGERATVGLTLNNNLEMKVKSDADSTGVKKVKIFDSFNFSTSYNFLADSLNLAPISITATTTLFNSLGVNFSAAWDPYKYNQDGIQTSELGFFNGSRITRARLSFGYSFRSVFGAPGGTGSATVQNTSTMPESQHSHGVMGQPSQTQIQALNALSNTTYYDFSIPWNLSFNYAFDYSHSSGSSTNITQTVALNGGLELTENWALNMSTNFDLSTMKLATSAISIVRDLHCWQMSFSWVPSGFRSSWSFNINVKSSALQDLKLKRSSSFYDNYYNTF